MPNPHSQPQEPLAIVGLACRLPDAESADEYWKRLLEGHNTCREVPPEVFAIDDYYDAAGAARNKMGARSGNWLGAKAHFFSPAFFGLTHEQSLRIDPQQRLSLMVAYEALEHTGFARFPDPDVGVFVAATCDDYAQNLMSHISEHDHHGTSRQFLAARLSDCFAFTGPSQTVDTACNASFVALDMACDKLRSGKCSAALVGGVSIITQPQVSIGLDKAHFLSRTGQCKTLDSQADGYSRSEAVSFVVVKRLSDAINANDCILGEILASGTNHSGEAHSITHPHAPAQAALMGMLLREAQVAPEDICLVEAHGTGTQAGDWNEVNAIYDTLIRARQQAEQQPVAFTSSKANLGHSEGASGLGALIKTLLIFKHGLVPPHIGIQGQLNPRLVPLFSDGMLALVRDEPLPLQSVQRGDSPAVAICNNFGAAGGNTSLVLRQHRERQPRQQSSPDQQELPFIVSAHTPAGLQQARTKLAECVGSVPLPSLSYTLVARRLLHEHKFVCTATTKEQLVSKLNGEGGASEAENERVDDGPAHGALEIALAKVPGFQRARREVDTACLALGLTPFSRFQEQDGLDSLPPAVLSFARHYCLRRTLQGWLPASAADKSAGKQSPAQPLCTLLAQAIETPGETDRLIVSALPLPNETLESLVRPLLAEADLGGPWFATLSRLLVAMLQQGLALDVQAAMADLTPGAELCNDLPPYQWDAEALYVPYTDRALVKPSWSDASRRVVVNTAPADEHLGNASRSPLSQNVSRLWGETFRIEPNGGASTVISVLRCCNQIVRQYTGVLRVGQLQWYDESLAQLGAKGKTLLATFREEQNAVELHEVAEVNTPRDLFDHGPLGTGKEASRLIGIVQYVQPETELAFAHAVGPDTGMLQGQVEELRTGANSNHVPGSAFYHILRQVCDGLTSNPEDDGPILELDLSQDCQACLVTMANGRLEEDKACLAAIQVLEEVTNFMLNKDSIGAPTSGTSPRFLGCQSVRLLSARMTLGDYDMLFLKHRETAQAYLVERQSSTPVGVFEGIIWSGQERIVDVPARSGGTAAMSMQTPSKMPSRVESSQAHETSEESSLSFSDASTFTSPNLSRAATESTQASSVLSEPVPAPSSKDSLEAFLAMTRKIISEETGTDAGALEDASFADVGIDSLMSLSILDRMREESSALSVDLEVPASLFIDCQSLDDLREFAAKQLGPSSKMKAIEVEAPIAPYKGPEQALRCDSPAPVPEAQSSRASSLSVNAVILSGRKSGDGGLRPVFLVPDGSGSAAVFRNIGSLDGRLVYGLNSPFLADPGLKWEGGVPEIAQHYIAQMRAKQPRGPYIIGGWSFGGVVSYEMVRQLWDAGETVDGLFLLDSPCPQRMPPLPHTIIDWAQASGALAGLGIKAFAPAMAAHFREAIKTLETYSPPALDCLAPGQLRVALLTAVDGVSADPSEVENTNETVEWLFGDRRGLGPHGWDKLCGAGRVEVREFRGNHFTMMEAEFAVGWRDAMATLLRQWGI